MHAQTTENTANEQAAKALAAQGIPVFPVVIVERPGKDPQKKPCIIGWQAKASADLSQIERWWRKFPDAMPGIPTGSRSGFNVLDVDRKNGKDGFAGLKQLSLNIDNLSPVQVESPGGSRHLYFKHTDGIGCSNAGLPAGLDVKGDGGYVLAPGAVTAKGAYTVVKGALTAKMPGWPEALPIRRKAAEPGEGKPTGLPMKVIAKALMAIPNSGDAYADRGAWLNLVMALHCEAGGSEEGLSLLHQWSRQHPRYDTDHTDATWHSCKADGGLTGWHVIHEAERYSWSDPAVAELREMARREEAEADFDSIADLVLPEEELDEIAALVHGPGSTAKLKGSTGLTFLNPSDCVVLPARRYVIKGLLAEGDVGTIVGAPGAGKSLLAPYLAYAVARGVRAFGCRTRAGGVFYAAAEDTLGMRARVKALRDAHGDAEGFRLVEGVSDLLTDKSRDLKELTAAVKRDRPALIVIDTVAIAFPGLEENDAKSMGRVVAVARSLTRWGAAVLLIHHDTKDGSNGLPRGHSILNGALDVNLYLKREDGVVTGKLTKNRNGATDQKIAFEVKKVMLGVDEDGDPITTAMCEETDAPKAEKKPTGQRKVAFDKLVELTDGRDGVSKSVWRDACYADSALTASDDLETKKKAFQRAVEWLVRFGKVQEFEGRFSPAGFPGEDFAEDMAGEDGDE